MRPIKVTHNSTINSTAFIVECKYHNISEPSLVIVRKKENEIVPTNVRELLTFATDRIMSSPSILNKETMKDLSTLDGNHWSLEDYTWRL